MKSYFAFRRAVHQDSLRKYPKPVVRRTRPQPQHILAKGLCFAVCIAF